MKGKKLYSVAFFPWLRIKRTAKIDKYTLFSFSALKRKRFDKKSEIIKQLESILQQYLNNITGNLDKPTITINKNPIVITKDFGFSPLANKERDDLFHLRNSLAYATICTNQYGRNILDRRYFNSTVFELIIQYFRLDSEGMAFQPRRRFYNDIQIGIRENFKFVMPIYASDDDELKYNKPIVKSLKGVISSYRSDDNLLRLLVALNWFFQAHTDSNFTGDKNDLIMMASAFEILLDITEIRGKKVALMNKIQDKFSKFKSLKRRFYQKTPAGNKGDQEHRSWKEFWLCRFYEERNKIAHSMKTPNLKGHWNKNYTHLTIADIIFDLLVRLYLEKAGLYKLSRYDQQKCNALDEFLSTEYASIDDVIKQHLDSLREKKIMRYLKNVINKGQ